MIIGLAGKRLSGKDTAGAYLVERHGFERLAFADKLREAVAALFDIPVERVNEYKGDGRSEIDYVEVQLDVGSKVKYTFGWVEFLQRFGTEMARNTFGQNFWVDLVLPDKRGHRDEDGVWHSYYNADIVITDVRFENEAQRILDLGGTIIQLVRPSVVDKSNDAHSSETGLPEDLIEYVIENTSTLESLFQDLDAVMENIHANSQ